MRPAWFPDWRGQTAVVVAAGPSAAAVPLSIARGKTKFLAIKSSVDLCPWADVLHAADFLWWDRHDGKKDFRGFRTTLNRRAAAAWGLNFLRSGFGTGMIFDDPGKVGWGGHSGYGAINLAAQLGAATIILVGFDMRIDQGVRWHAPHGEGSTDPDAATVKGWRIRLDAAAPSLAAHGVRVINTSAVSALTAYEMMSFHAALA